MTDTAKLKEAIAFSGLTRDKIASGLEISTHSLNKKIYNKAEFKASEIEALSDILAITDVKAIFFARDVDLHSTTFSDVDWQSEERKIKKSKNKPQAGKWFGRIALIIVAFLAFTIIGNQNTIMVMQTSIINMLHDMRIEQDERWYSEWKRTGKKEQKPKNLWQKKSGSSRIPICFLSIITILDHSVSMPNVREKH